MAYFDLKVGFTCNNNCVHCVITDKKSTKDLTTDEIKNIISSRPIEDIIGFTGGEPTIRKDFIELAKFAKEKGHEVYLQTNGTKFSNEIFAKEASRYIDHILIAIHSCNRDVHDKIVQSSGMWDKTINGFKNIIKYNINYSTQTVISKLNISNILETYDMIQEMSPNCKMNFTFPHPNGNAYRNYKTVVPKYSEIKIHIQEVLEKYAHLISVEAIPFCYLYPYQDKVYHNFDEDLLKGELNRGGIDASNTNVEFFDREGVTEDYFSSMLSDKIKGFKCKDCIFDDRCPGVWKEYLEFYRDEFDLFPITKGVAHLEEPKDEVLNKDKKNGALILYGNEKCMNTCLFCSGNAGYQDEKKKWETAKEDVDYLVKDGVTHIEISGGDPGEYGRLVDIVRYINQSGIKNIQLSTHGRTLKEIEFVKDLKKSGLKSVKVPLYGSNEEIHNMCTQVNNSKGNAFFDTLIGIKNCRECGIEIIGYIVPNQFNKNDLVNIVNLYTNVAKNYLIELYFGISFIADKKYSYTNNWFLPLKDFGYYMKPIINNIPNLPKNLKFVILDVPYCSVGGFTPYIENKFEGFPNLGKHDVEEQNRSEKSSKIPHYRVKSYFKECEICVYNKICGGIPKNEIEMFGAFGLKGFKEGKDV